MAVNDRDGESVLDANASPLLKGRESEGPSSPEAQHPHRERFAGVRGIYFDLDDTLCAYWDASKTGLRRAFEQHGPDGFTPEECVQAWARAFRSFAPTLKKTGWYATYLKTGEPTRTEQMRLTLKELGCFEEERARRLSEAYCQERDAALSLFEDALDVLSALKGRYPLGLITNGPADVQRMEVATLGIEPFFDHILIEGELGEGKPNTRVFEQARGLMGLEARELLMVGNSYLHDIKPAIENGWLGVWVRRPSDIPPSAGGDDPKPEERPEDMPEPHAVINDLRSLLDLLPAR